MRKLFTILALAAITLGANAQYEGHKFFDNWSLGVSAGAITPTVNHPFWKSCRPNFGVELTKQVTPVFAIAVEGRANVNTTPSKNAIDQMNVSYLNKVNLTNLFCGYKGKPRFFEIEAVAGMGIGTDFVPSTQDITNYAGNINLNDETTDDYSYLTSKFGLNLLFNLGSKKAWTFALKPAIVYNLDGQFFPGFRTFPSGAHWDVRASAIELAAGLTYHFKSSNGEHYFTKVRPYDQAEVDGLNAEINRLRNELAKKPKEVVKEVIKEVKVGGETKTVKVEDLVFVTFAQGKSALTKDAKAALDGVKSGAHVQIVGTASPEGPADLNQRLSQARADVVADYLRGRGVVVDEATGKGVQGTTSNRLAIVYVK